MNLPVCRSCGKANDAQTHANPSIPAVPHDGDFSLCLYCGVWSVFDAGILRAPDEGERNMIRTSTECQRAEFAHFLFKHGRRS
jgi:hypothetical protein